MPWGAAVLDLWWLTPSILPPDRGCTPTCRNHRACYMAGLPNLQPMVSAVISPVDKWHYGIFVQEATVAKQSSLSPVYRLCFVISDLHG